jgi:glycosyltransferase involved in cell wall biosynthesis
MKIALAHDFLVEYGGAERVLEALHEIFPKAPVYTAFYDPESLGPHAGKFKNWDIRTSWGTRLPFWRRLISPYRIFSKSFFQSFDLSGFDVVISSSNAYLAKAVKVPNGVHICYCHTPPRFLYGYPTPVNWKKNPILRPIGEVVNHFMRVWDFETSQKPASPDERVSRGGVDYFIANSKEVQRRIKKFYRRDSVVIYPPVDVERFSQLATRDSRKSEKRKAKGGYFLVVSRLVGSKNVGIAVEVCKKLKLSLKVVGTGKDQQKLTEIAEGSTVELLGEVPDEELISLYLNCRAVLFTATNEDFGLVPVEAMAAGKPVIAVAEGGVLETIIDASAGSAQAGKTKGKCTGVYFDPPTIGSLTVALNNFSNLEKKGYFDPKFIRTHAQKFGKDRFEKEISEFVADKTSRPGKF